MKYISEEDLIKWIEGRDEWWLEDTISPLLKELDELTVTKLRPMSEAKVNEEILGWHKYRKEFIKTFRTDDAYFYFAEDDMHYGDDDFDGWIPLPTYKPEE